MDHMLMCFERDATKWLRQVKIEFDAKNQQFDEHFRKTFIQTSNDRYDDAHFYPEIIEL